MSLDPLYTAVSWILLRWHALFSALGLDPKGGLNWALSIVFLVVTARLLLFRFFIKQVHYQRRMQEIQPKIKKLQDKHKGDKATLQREMMALQQAEGFNPISGCLPMVLQLPIFISLFHVLKHMSAAVSPNYPEAKRTLYGFTRIQTENAAHAKLFNAPLAASLRESVSKVTDPLQLGGSITSTRLVIVVLVVVSAGATVITQRAVTAAQTTQPEGQAATIQRLMKFGIPASVVFSGLIFPIGVLLYWFTSNLWTAGQQYYILRFHPHPAGAGSPVGGTEKSAPAKAIAPKVGQRPVNKRKIAPPAKPGSEDGTAAVANSASKPPGGDAPASRRTGGPAAPDVPISLSKKDSPPVSNKAADAQKPNGAKPAASGPSQRANRTSSSNPRRSPSKKRR